MDVTRRRASGELAGSKRESIEQEGLEQRLKGGSSLEWVSKQATKQSRK